MAETVCERLSAAWARTDRIFELVSPRRFPRAADRAAPSVHLLRRTLAGLRVESHLRRGPRAAIAQCRIRRALLTGHRSRRRRPQPLPRAPGDPRSLASAGRGARLSRSRPGRSAGARGRGGGAGIDASHGPRRAGLPHGASSTSSCTRRRCSTWSSSSATTRRSVRRGSREPSRARGGRPATIMVPAGTATLGVETADLAFGWDNEFPTSVRPRCRAFRWTRRL